LKYRPIIGGWINRKVFFLAFICLTFIGSVDAQSQKDLEKKQHKVAQKIKQTEKELQNNKAQKKSTLKDFNDIQQKITVRKGAIQQVKVQLTMVDNRVGEKEQLIFALKNEINILKEEYAKIMRQAYRASLITNEWMLILSSASINEAFSRWHYLRQVKIHRRAQALTIGTKQLALEDELAKLHELKYSNQLLLNKEENQTNLLNTDLDKKNTLLANLTESEKSLLSNLKRQKKEQKNIQAEISRVIRLEIARKEREAKALAEKARKAELARIAAEQKAAKAEEKEEIASSDNSTADVRASSDASHLAERNENTKAAKLTRKKNIEITESPSSASLSADFQSNRGALGWPVRRGAIVRGFGKQNHAELDNVTIVNNGIDIKTETGATAMAVFEGEVIHIAFITGYKNTVMVNHGKYYTIYSNLDNVFVQKGQKVKVGTALGTAALNGDSGNTELHFELWSKQSPLNPVSWLKAR